MKLVLHRSWKLATYTIGRLLIDCTVFCDTLEDPVRDLVDKNNDGDFNDDGEGKIYGNTAIPAGTYKITLELSPHFGRKLPYLHDVPGFSGVLIHAGNSAADTSGCILVGSNNMAGRVINSRAYENLLVQKMEKAVAAGEEIYITIYN